VKVVIHSNSRIWGGNEKWLLMVAEGLADRGHEVLISCKPARPVAERARAAGLRVTHARPGGDADVFRALGFAAMVRRERPDAVLLTAFKRVFWAGWAARRAGVSRVVQRLGIEHDLPASWKYRHAFAHYVDALIVNSRVIRDRWLTSARDFPPEEVHVVLNGVRRPERTVSTLREELGLPPSEPVVAGAGRLEERKGFDLLLGAFAATGGERAHLVVAGEGEEGPALRSRARALGVADRVHWLGFRRDLDNVLLGCDVFVLPSRAEGMANVMLEAMAAGCPVVATDISGVREAIGELEGRPPAGWIVPVDAGALGAGLRAALDVAADPSALGALRKEAAWRVAHWFSPESTVAATERVLAGRALR
jgi:glycosyltransferase involved in cell wall biosynthesis